MKQITALSREVRKVMKLTAEEIKQKRKEAGMTQEQLAHKLGVAVATIQRWEKGVHRPSPMAARQLWRALKKGKS